jgi:two-component system cell cycle response regulator DivK
MINTGLRPPGATPPTALIVDRDADTRRMYAQYLELASWVAEEAAQGDAALTLAFTRRHDVIVIANRVGFISGHDLCRMLKHDPATSMTPIVFVTSDAFKADVVRARHAGAAVVLSKPCLPERLLLELNRQLAKETTISIPGRIHGLTFTMTRQSPVSCPTCERTLIHLEVDADDDGLFDYYVCRGGCGTLRYPRARRNGR